MEVIQIIHYESNDVRMTERSENTNPVWDEINVWQMGWEGETVE